MFSQQLFKAPQQNWKSALDHFIDDIMFNT